jgi:D-arabinose 1-dehydrogenase-like Zn-dependent alcohol dehydrogenase
MGTKMKAAQISKAGGDWELVERDIPEPGPGQVRVKVEACGICHSDVLVKDGIWPGLQYPRVPGHEIAGRVDAVGGNVHHGQLVSVSVSVGMAAIASSASNAGVVTSRCASIAKSPGSILTVVMPRM